MRATIVAATLAATLAVCGASAGTAAADLRGYECTLAFWHVDWEEVPGEAIGHGSGTCTTADSPGGFTGTITYRGGWYGSGPDVGLDGTLTVEDGFNPPASESIRGQMTDLVTPSGAHLRATAGDWECDDYVRFLYCGNTPRSWTAYPPSHLTSTNPPTPVEGPPRNRFFKPAVGGAPVVGTPLRASAGTWYGSNISYAYQWRRCDETGGACEDILGATGQQYTPSLGDVGHTLKVRVTASNAQGSAVAESGPSQPVESPESPPAEPEAEQEDVDDETTYDRDLHFVAVEGDLALAFEAGRMTLAQAMDLSAARGRPPYHCVASVSKKVGGLRQISGNFEGRTVRWSHKETCTGGGGSIYMRGHSYLNRFSSVDNEFHLFAEGPRYSGTYTGNPMQAKRTGRTVEGKTRKIKQVEWHMVTEVPPPYQWAKATPGELNGVNRKKTHCRRYPIDYPGWPVYLSGLTCVIYGHQFR